MHTSGTTTYWSRTPAPARPALLATLLVLAVGLASFVALLWAESAYFGLSPLTLILIPPAPGAPSLWLGMVLLAVALRQRGTLLRRIGAVAAFAIAALCVAVLVTGALTLVDYLSAGNLPGDFGDLLGILLFAVPLALVVGALNARAFLLEVRELFQ